MALVNYRDARERFTHIDAQFEACQVRLPDGDGFYTVRLYPWWEHPDYLRARAAGAPWGIHAADEAYLPVTVYPRRLREARISEGGSVTDWDFTQDHPLLWPYEPSPEITCNQPLSLEQWAQIADAARDKLTGYGRHAGLGGYESWRSVARWGRSGAFSLGRFPRPLFLALRRTLDERGVRYFAPHEPVPVTLPVLFLVDGDDYLIADDFEVDVPEFVHKPEWFQPR